MIGLREILAEAAEITGRNIALISEDDPIGAQGEAASGIPLEEARRHAGGSYKGWRILPMEDGGQTCYICIQRKGGEDIKAEELILLAARSAVSGRNPEEEQLKALLKTGCEPAARLRLEAAYGKRLKGYVIVVDGYEDSLDEVLQIMDNTFETTLAFELDDRIVAISEEEDVEDAGGALGRNILSELLLECTVVIGGKSGGIGDFRRLYDRCLEALYLKRIFGLTDMVLNYDRLYAYRVANSLDSRVKADILAKVLTPAFRDMLNSELSMTIEALFRNNLNLTDTAGKLYIHRNTLLYRLDKIFKSTGFDLKKFEDSWLFRLAWLINKEKE